MWTRYSRTYRLYIHGRSPLPGDPLCGLCSRCAASTPHLCNKTDTIHRRPPQTQQCTCAAPLNDHIAIVNPYRIPAALPYLRAGFFAGGVQSNAGTPSNARRRHLSQHCESHAIPSPPCSLSFSPTLFTGSLLSRLISLVITRM